MWFFIGFCAQCDFYIPFFSGRGLFLAQNACSGSDTILQRCGGHFLLQVLSIPGTVAILR